MKFLPYSVSKINLYFQCPEKFKLKYVDKIKTVSKGNFHLYKGEFLHRCLELGRTNFRTKAHEYFTKELKLSYIESYNKFKNYPIVKEYLEHNGNHEIEFGLKVQDNKLVLSEFSDKTSLLIGKIDYRYSGGKVTYIIDWKTGKIGSINQLQAMIYSLYEFITNNDCEECICSNVFVEYNVEDIRKYYRKDFLNILKNVISRISEIESTKEFYPLHNCRFCEYNLYKICGNRHE